MSDFLHPQGKPLLSNFTWLLSLFVFLAAIGLPTSAPSQSESTRKQDELAPLPEPSLDNAEFGVRKRLEEARSAIDWLLSQGTIDSVELAQAYGELGRLYLANGLNAAAVVAFSNALLSMPAEFRWAYYLGALQHQERRLEKGEWALRHALKLRPGDVPSLLRLGDLLLLAERPVEAAEPFNRALELTQASPSRAFAQYGLGKIAMNGERWHVASLHFEAALDAAPEASAVRRLLGLAYRELGDREKAREQLEASGQDAVSFVDPLMESLANVETGGFLWSALNARRRGDLELAASLYRQAIEAEGESGSHRRSLSNVLALQGDVAGAIAELERAIKLEPRHVASQIQMGQLLARTGKRDQGLEFFNKAVQLAPNAREPKVALARSLAMGQRHEEALVYYDQVVALDPRDSRARLLRARSKSRLGRDAEAIEDLELVLAAEPDETRAMLEMATVLARQGEHDRALGIFESALKLELVERDRILALFSSAALRQQRGDDAGAISLYREVLELAPEMKDAHFNLAAALARAGQSAEAEKHFRRAVEIEPGDVSARLAWVRALEGGGDHGAARSALEDVVKGQEAQADVRLVHRLAQMLSGSSEPAQRDAPRAVELATEVVRRDATVQHALTLARALAEAGRAEEAVALQRKILADSEGLGLSAAQLNQLRQLLTYYEGLVKP